MNIKMEDVKIKILSRLIKESSLTLEEVLILLDKDIDNQSVISHIASNDTIICTNGSTWNSSYSYARYDETPTL